MGHRTLTVFFSLFRKIDTHFDFRSPAKVLEAFEAALEILVLGPVHIKKTNLLQDTLDDTNIHGVKTRLRGTVLLNVSFRADFLQEVQEYAT